jgi:hypothetical protein
MKKCIIQLMPWLFDKAHNTTQHNTTHVARVSSCFVGCCIVLYWVSFCLNAVRRDELGMNFECGLVAVAVVIVEQEWVSKIK